MKLSDIFAQLTHGELSQLSLGGAEAGQIDASNYAKVIAHVNLGLASLYKRFPLKEGRLLLELQTDRSVYPLSSGYAVSNPAVNGLPRYILDSEVDPFLDDILKIEAVLTDLGFSMGLNDASNIYGISTPTAQSMRVPLALVTESMDIPSHLITDTLELVYRANHPIILHTPGIDPTMVYIELPYSHLEPLLYFVASRVNNPIGMTNEFHAGNSYAAKYEQACALLEHVNLNVDQGSQNTRAARGGWV